MPKSFFVSVNVGFGAGLGSGLGVSGVVAGSFGLSAVSWGGGLVGATASTVCFLCKAKTPIAPPSNKTAKTAPTITKETVFFTAGETLGGTGLAWAAVNV